MTSDKRADHPLLPGVLIIPDELVTADESPLVEELRSAMDRIPEGTPVPRVMTHSEWLAEQSGPTARPRVYIGESEAPRQELAATFASLLDAVLREPELSDREAWINATADVMSRVAVERLCR